MQPVRRHADRQHLGHAVELVRLDARQRVPPALEQRHRDGLGGEHDPAQAAHGIGARRVEKPRHDRRHCVEAGRAAGARPADQLLVEAADAVDRATRDQRRQHLLGNAGEERQEGDGALVGRERKGDRDLLRGVQHAGLGVDDALRPAGAAARQQDAGGHVGPRLAQPRRATALERRERPGRRDGRERIGALGVDVADDRPVQARRTAPASPARRSSASGSAAPRRRPRAGSRSTRRRSPARSTPIRPIERPASKPGVSVRQAAIACERAQNRAQLQVWPSPWSAGRPGCPAAVAAIQATSVAVTGRAPGRRRSSRSRARPGSGGRGGRRGRRARRSRPCAARARSCGWCCRVRRRARSRR